MPIYSYSRFLPLSSVTNFILPFLHTHLIHFILLAAVMVLQAWSADNLAIHRPPIMGLHRISSLDHGSRLGCETIGLSRSTLQRALLVVILLTSIRGIKNFNRRNALGGVNCNYLHEWIFGLPLNLKQFWINLIFIPFEWKPINWYQYENYKTYRFTPYR